MSFLFSIDRAHHSLPSLCQKLAFFSCLDPSRLLPKQGSGTTRASRVGGASRKSGLNNSSQVRHAPCVSEGRSPHWSSNFSSNPAEQSNARPFAGPFPVPAELLGAGTVGPPSLSPDPRNSCPSWKCGSRFISAAALAWSISPRRSVLCCLGPENRFETPPGGSLKKHPSRPEGERGAHANRGGGLHA